MLQGFQGTVLGNDCICILTGWEATALQDPRGLHRIAGDWVRAQPLGGGIGELLISRDGVTAEFLISRDGSYTAAGLSPACEGAELCPRVLPRGSASLASGDAPELTS